MNQPVLNRSLTQLTSAIANVFAVEGDLADSAVEKLHNELIGVVLEANERLRQCDDLLRRGLRQEALQECEEEPNLLDLVTQLDFAEWDAWGDYVAQFGFPPQPALLLDVAAELNEAYAAAQSLDSLLKSHRLHALARSPLPVRLGVLRTIAARDPKNPAWQADLNAYETARQKQLGPEFQTHVANGDLRAVAELRRELEDSRWVVAPPQALVEQVAAGHKRLVAMDARTRLGSLEPIINAAFAAFDVQAIKRARTQWETNWPLAGLPSDDRLALQVQPAFEWLRDESESEQRQHQYEKDLAALDRALDDDDSHANELTRLFATLERYDEPLPARVQRRFDERLRGLQLAQHRRSRLRLVSSVVGIALLGAIVGLVIFRQLRASEVTAAADAINKFLTSDQPEQAKAYYDDLAAHKPYITDTPKLRAVFADLQGRLKRNAGRKERLSELIEQAQALIKSPNWDSVTNADKLLRDAKSIAMGEDEQVRVLTVQREVGAARATLQTETDSVFKKDVAAFRLWAEAHLPQTIVDAADIVKRARTLRSRLWVSPEARDASGIDLLIAKAEDQEQAIVRGQDQNTALQHLVASVGALPAFKSSLEEYIKVNGNSARATDFQEVLDQELGELDRIAIWNDLAAAWNGGSLQSSTDAGEAIKTIDSLAKGFAGFPSAKDAVLLKPYAESVLARQKDDGKDLLSDMREILKNGIFNMKRMKHPREDGYLYFFEDPRHIAKSAESSEIYLVLNLRDSRNPKDTEPLRFGAEEFLNAMAQSPSLASPQKRFAEAANRWLTDAKVPYEKAVCAVLIMLFTDKEMDPILKCSLLKTFHDLAAPGSSILSEELRRFRTHLDSNYPLEDQNFLSSDDSQVTEARENCRDLLKLVPPGETPSVIYQQRIEPRVKKIMDGNIRLPRLDWCGVLLKSASDSWEVRVGPNSPSAAQAPVAVLIKNQDGDGRVETIGQIVGGKISLNQSASDYYREGRPVFCMVVSK